MQRSAFAFWFFLFPLATMALGTSGCAAVSAQIQASEKLQAEGRQRSIAYENKKRVEAECEARSKALEVEKDVLGVYFESGMQGTVGFHFTRKLESERLAEILAKVWSFNLSTFSAVWSDYALGGKWGRTPSEIRVSKLEGKKYVPLAWEDWDDIEKQVGEEDRWLVRGLRMAIQRGPGHVPRKLEDCMEDAEAGIWWGSMATE